jgi:outer membrane murein-binding lipoprotein Lpp
LTIRWETVERVSKDGGAVVTGDSGTASEPTEVALRWGERPIVVYVCDEAAGCEGFDKLEEVVLKDEKVALGMKAFRTVKMHPDHADVDPVTKGKGKDVPRMLIIDPTKMKVTVLDKSKLKASALYSAMKKVAGKSYKEKLDKVVKTHLKLLTKQDQLANAEKTLAAKEARLAGEDGKSAEKELEKLKEERAELRKEIQDMAKEQKEIWKLTLKSKAT